METIDANAAESKKTMADLSIEVKQIMQFLRTINIGDFVSFLEIQEAGKLSNLPTAQYPLEYGRLYRARRKLEEESIFFDRVCSEYGHGLKRLNANETVNFTGKAVEQINRRAKLGDQRLTNNKYEDLDLNSKMKSNTLRTIFRVTGTITSPKIQTRLEGLVANACRPAEIDEVFKCCDVRPVEPTS